MNYYFFEQLPPDAKMIREEVFMNEQGFTQEFDEIDSYAIHLIIYENGVPVATGRLYNEDESQEYIFGRVAVMKNFRGKNHGAKVIEILEEKARELGGTKISLSAQLHAQPFYEKLGFKAFGEKYLDESCEHIHMEKHLN